MAAPARKKRRSRKRKGKNLFVIAASLALLIALLIGLAVFYVKDYKEKLIYKQYPLAYKELIVEMADEFELEPWHIAAVVRCESSFNPKATSNVGARGLMQIMPETGEWLAGKFDEEAQFDAEWLYQPEYNLKYGCWYLGWLMRRYNDDIIAATAAYHAGQTCVDGWLADPQISPDGKTLLVGSIPYDSTRTYVNRIIKAYTNYKELYDYET